MGKANIVTQESSAAPVGEDPAMSRRSAAKTAKFDQSKHCLL